MTGLNGFAEKIKSIITIATQNIALPIIGILIFLLLWSAASQNIQTSLGDFPSPQSVMSQFGSLYDEHITERGKEHAFYERQEVRNAERAAADPTYEPRVRPYTGKETFLDQIVTSLKTVGAGFFIAALIAIPLGIATGLSKPLNTAVNPIIQIFKPVSPLAWLPLVTIVVSALYTTPDPIVYQHGRRCRFHR